MITKNCECCNQEFTTENQRKITCSVKCRVNLSRKRKRLALDLRCHYCAVEITKKSHYKFCCEEHKKLFHKRKECNTPIQVMVKKGLVISTRKYWEIPDLVAKMTSHVTISKPTKEENRKEMNRKNSSIKYLSDSLKPMGLKENI